MVVGRAGRVTPDQARRLAQELLGRIAGGCDPAGERAEARSLPTRGEACEDYMESGHGRAASTERGYRRYAALYLGDWLSRSLDTITRLDVETWRAASGFSPSATARCRPTSACRSCARCTEGRAWTTRVSGTGGAVAFGRGAVPPQEAQADLVSCRGVAVLAQGDRGGGGRCHAPGRVPVRAPYGDAAWRDPGASVGAVDLGKGLFRVEETKTGVPLELPVTRQLQQVLARRREEGMAVPEELRGWVFPSRSSVSGHVEELQMHYGAIGRAGGAKFWFHGLRNAFIAVAERDLMLPRSLTKRLVNHARPGDVTEGYAADWTVEQLRDPAQRIADRIDELTP